MILLSTSPKHILTPEQDVSRRVNTQDETQNFAYYLCES